MTASTFLALGRVSNLPTVWTNTLAGAWLAGTSPSVTDVAAVGFAMSLFYTGGMFLNDAFDREIDAVERPQRPIPSGRAAAGAVLLWGSLQLAAGLALLVGVALLGSGDVSATTGAGIGLAALVVLYDAAHRNNPLAPWVMGACRGLVYVSAAAATCESPAWTTVVPAALAVAVYTAGITYVAEVESSGLPGRLWPALLLALAPSAPLVFAETTRLGVALSAAVVVWIVYALAAVRRRGRPDVPGCVTRLIAGMSLVDAAWIAACGPPSVALAALCGLPAARLLQRRIAGS